MISVTDCFIVRDVGDLNNESHIDHWKIYNHHVVDVSKHRRQCFQYFLSVFYHYVGDIDKYTIIWSVVSWGQYGVINVFVFNWILGHITAVFYDVDRNGNWGMLMNF